MISFSAKPPEPTRPSRAGKKKMGGLKPALSKGLSRLFQPVQILAFFGRVQTRTHQGLYGSAEEAMQAFDARHP